MSCLGPNYNPVPPRVWSRVQNRCTFDTNPPLFTGLNKITNKANILQYKKNSSNLTQKQRYSQIAKGMWTNRTTTWATQTETYSNPNVLNLQQINYDVIPIPEELDPYGCVKNFIKDGGILIGNTYVNPCTDEVIKKTFVQQCYPTTCSDVPGTPILLCWNGRLQPWYPKSSVMQTMNNSTDKWPINYKFLKSAYANLPSGTVIPSASELRGRTRNFLSSFDINPELPLSSYIYNGVGTVNVTAVNSTANLTGNANVMSTLSTLNTNSTTMNVNNINIDPSLTPNVLNFATISAADPKDLSLNTSSSSYTDLYNNRSYTIPYSGIFAAESTTGNTVIALPETIPNWKDVTIVNKTDFGLFIVVSNAVQSINNYFFAPSGEQIMTLAINNVGQFKYIDNPTTGIGSWIVNVF